MMSQIRVFMSVIGSCILLMGTSLAGPKESLEFAFVMSGGVSGDGSRSESIRGNNSPVWIGADFNLSPAFFIPGDETGLLGAEGDECFFGGIFRASMQMTETKDGSAKAILFFRAFSSDGSDTEIKYVLTLVDSLGWVDSGGSGAEFPPRNNVVTMNATAWELTTEGKGQHRKISCTGSGGSEIDVELTLWQPPPQP